jgi:putative drug exporter of the RND superfamily
MCNLRIPQKNNLNIINKGSIHIMFTKLAEFTRKYRIIITAIWLAAAVVLFFAAPKLSKVGVTDDSQFLPQNTESSEASKLIKDKFAAITPTAAGTGIILIHDTDGLSADDMQQAKEIHDWLVSSAAPQEIERVTSIFENDALRAVLISTDQTTMMIKIDFSVSSLTETAKTDLQQIRSYIEQNHPKLETYFTGEFGLFQDMMSSVQQTIDRTTIVTLILVAILLLIIYRSPVAILLPLIAIGCSFAVSSGLIGFLAQAGGKFSTLTEAYLVVIIFGVGTDYCLFLVSRFREELHLKERHEAQNDAIKHISPVIAASALTVVIAFLSLGVSSFGMNKTTGYALAIGVATTLLAGLTLVPALMSLFGKYLFWPVKTAGPKKEGRFGWHVLGKQVSQHPLWFVVPILIVLLMPYAALPSLVRSADMTSQLPPKIESVKGLNLLNEQFAGAASTPLNLLIESPQGNMTGTSAQQAIQEIAQSLLKVKGVTGVDYFSAPANQLTAQAAQISSIGDEVGQGNLDQLDSFQLIGQTLQGLGLQYPGIQQSPNFMQVGLNLTTISTISAQIPTTQPADLPAMLDLLQKAIYRLADTFTGMVSEFTLQTTTPFSEYLLSTYFSTDKTIAEINITLIDSTDSKAALDTVARVRTAAANLIKASTLAGSKYYVGGQSATQADIMSINDADFGRVVGLALAGILVVIAILLRSLIAPLYMVATVLLNYGTTLGITTWLFLDLMKQGSLIYMMPLFIFVILVALGADYNIFLVSRIREEAHDRSMKEAVSRAVANTGGVITACGIILAGTFATLIISPLRIVIQIGTAIAVGVLMDTFVVRALLVPALATLIGRWSWWPSGLFKKVEK